MFPSFKYGLGAQALSVSAIVGVISEWLGFSPALVVVMFLTVIIETVTGIRASTKLGQHFESFKFSRCIIKVAIWCFLFFFFHAFSKDMARHTGAVYSAGVWFFDIVNVTTMAYFVIEYGTSILENLSVIDGKPKETLINTLRGYWLLFVERFRSSGNDSK
jgi:hypothetical protein